MLLRRFFFRIFMAVWRRGRWIRRRFTDTGILVLAVFVISGLIGLDTKRTMIHQVFALSGVLLALSFLWWRFKSNIVVERSFPAYVTAGEAATYSIRIENRSARTKHGLILFEDLEWQQVDRQVFLKGPGWRKLPGSFFSRISGWPRFYSQAKKATNAHASRIVLPALEPGASVVVKASVMPMARGRLRSRGLWVARPDPMGLFLGLDRLDNPSDCVVLPRRHKVGALDLPGTRRLHRGGLHFALSVGESEEFISLRDYRPGDSKRRIHWKSFAKHGHPVVREYAEEYFVRHALVLDTFYRGDDSGRFEEAVSIAASFAQTMLTQDSLLDFLFVGTKSYCFSAGRGLGNVAGILEVLASVAPCREKPFDILARSVLDRAAQMSACILVLLEWDSPRRELVASLRGLGIPLKVLVICKEDLPPLQPGPLLDDPAQFIRVDPGQGAKVLASL
ncbi:MAG: DUF58 domain-containing protein [Desulfatibacillaceae bacterium]|nr:DUF58 domain-containing protein [Desulfatibacillaceae bacterium]